MSNILTSIEIHKLPTAYPEAPDIITLDLTKGYKAVENYLENSLYPLCITQQSKYDISDTELLVGNFLMSNYGVKIKNIHHQASIIDIMIEVYVNRNHVNNLNPEIYLNQILNYSNKKEPQQTSKIRILDFLSIQSTLAKKLYLGYNLNYIINFYANLYNFVLSPFYVDDTTLYHLTLNFKIADP